MCTGPAWAAPACEPRAGKAVSVQGEVEIRHIAQPHWSALRLHEDLCPGDRIRLGRHSRAAVLLANRTLLRLDADTTITFSQVAPKAPSWLDLIKGAVHLISRTPRKLEIRTPFVNAAIEGTEFALRVGPDRTAIWVFEGRVVLRNAAGSLQLASGKAAVAEAGRPPRPRLVARPRDAVQWALYYPPLIDYRVADAPGPVPKAMRDAVEHYRRDELPAAFARLEAVPRAQRTARYHTLRAALLLNVGRVGEARSDIAQALRLEPGDSTAYALDSVIALVQNDRDKALALAQQAERLDPRSPIARIALSYAYQARFHIERALQEAKKAIALAPEDSRAWARLAELELSVGDLDRALAAARRAVEIAPDLARTQIVLGFAFLTQIKIGDAKAAFEKAIDLDPAAPLARLGLGLAQIRQGHLNKGTREIEIAAILDPNNSLVRSYLGKAYYEQRRQKLAASEFAIAKQLDPKDPTPYLYDAVLKQTTNRPVEALRDLQKSIELNDNRAVYRSRLLLDQDLAARAASLGRIYRDLRFSQLALREGWKSANTDPTNYSAHRLLADSYMSQPRVEIARVSELLQAQLLQPLTLAPLQPQLLESNLSILEGSGPSELSFDEFTPLFTRDRVALLAHGVVGSNDTWGDDVALSGLKGPLSFSLGQFHYESDGFRDNNDLKHDIYDAFFQINPTPKTSLQFEYRSRETDSGDIEFRFDPDNLFPQDKRDIDTDTLRAGFHYAATPASDLLISVIYQDRTENSFLSRRDATSAAPFTVDIDVDGGGDADGYLAEAQYQWRSGRLHTIVGGGHFDQNGQFKFTVKTRILELPLPAVTSPRQTRSVDVRHHNGYIYSILRLPQHLTWTLGLSYDDYDDDNTQTNREQLNPKLGLVWGLTETTSLRMAAFRTLKRPLLSNQTVEPTQIAGFNQFFDDLNGSDAKRYGLALDQRLFTTLYGGIELTRRDIDVFTSTGIEDQDEDLHTAYVYWTPTDRIALSGEYQYDAFHRDITRADQPKDLETHTFPMSVSYFLRNGLISRVQAIYARQDIELSPFTGGSSDNTFKDKDAFWIFDAELGYRFPKRIGNASVLVKNIFDKNFDYQDQNFRSQDPVTPRFIPERTVFFKLTLNL